MHERRRTRAARRVIHSEPSAGARFDEPGVPACERRANWSSCERSDLEFISGQKNVGETATAIVAAWQAGAIRRDTMTALFRRGEVLPEGRSREEDEKLIAEEGVPAT